MQKYCMALFLFSILFSQNIFAKAIINHEIEAEIFPSLNKIVVVDRMSRFVDLKSNDSSINSYIFSLHENNQLSVFPKSVKIEKQDRVVINGVSSRVKYDRYKITIPTNVSEVEFRYELTINYSLKQESEEYDRSVSDTPGMISEMGVYLANESLWFPFFGNELVTFNLQLTLPKGWKSVSQGERLEQFLKGNKNIEIWKEKNPQDDIYVSAAKFVEYEQMAGKVKAMAFLRKKDDALAQKYLDTTAQYLEMYQKILGPYPYKKFALVENFWESGWGMPSFTLLGSEIIRFPFILHSSYPHELLHNWWGNSVYMDWSRGNWAEGLTTYLADHLVSEQRGKGETYRRSTLQKYTDYTQSGKDLALKDFVSRVDSTTQAVGYGKTMMFFHMLRNRLGDEVFLEAIEQFYREYQFKEASYADIQRVFSKVYGKDLSSIFQQWVARVGAPVLALSSAKVVKKDKRRFELNLTLSQLQKKQAYDLWVPVVVSLKGLDKAKTKWLELNKKSQLYTLNFTVEPERVDIDPGFDIFRRLDLHEVPPALSQMFGASRTLIILPKSSYAELKDAYKALAENWQKTRHSDITIKWDEDISVLPSDKAVWILGWENKYRSIVESSVSAYDVSVKSKKITVVGNDLDTDEVSVILVGRNPKNIKHGLALISAGLPKAMPGLARKLPHYGRYSYLAFEGTEPVNFVKGQWPVIGSPLSKTFKRNAVMASLNKRDALAELSPLFSKQRMLKHISRLSSEEMQGRGILTAGIEKSSKYIKDEFRKAGLKPYQNGHYFQVWDQKIEGVNDLVSLKNIIGVLPGTNAKYNDEVVIVSAHYDHFGLGEIVSRKKNKGKVHFGADDNASGVSVMLELATLLSKQKLNERTILFIAFTGEELGLIGSRHFVKSLSERDKKKIMGVVNLDAVGRLGNNPLIVFGTGSASEWVHIFRGAEFVTGVNVKPFAKDFGFSDQKSFIDEKIPSVQFFSGVNLDFHQPTDTLDKIDGDGLLKVAAVLKETVVYLSEREEPLTNLLNNSLGNVRPKTSHGKGERKGRRVSLGTVPDFTFSGKGVLVTDVVPKSPAEKAGVKADDVIIAIDGKVIAGLRDFSQVLKSKKPGDDINLEIKRGDKKIEINATLIER